LTTYKGNSGKNRGNKKSIPRWIENPEGRFRQKWDEKKNNKNKQKRACKKKSIDHRCDIQDVLNIKAPNSDSQQKGATLYKFMNGI